MRCAYQRFGAWLLMALFVSVFLYAVPARADKAGEAEDAFAAAVAAVHDGDDERAIHILRPFAEAGNVKAMSLLGSLLYEDENVEAQRTAGRWLVQAAKAGDVNAMADFVVLSLEGNLLPIYKVSLRNFLEQASESGHPLAQALLAFYYFAGSSFPDVGLYVEKNLARSEYWARKALGNGQLIAKELLFAIETAPLHLNDLRLGNVWRNVLQLSDGGYASISIIRGEVYMGGGNRLHGVFDPVKAAKWFVHAIYINEGSAKAKALLNKLNLKGKVRDVTVLADPWFLEHAEDKGTRYGNAAGWCVRHVGLELRCLRAAILDHLGCLPPYFPGYFDTYTSSPGYDRCREEQLQKEAPDLFSLRSLKSRSMSNG